MRNSESPNEAVDPIFEQMMVENMRGSFLRETSGDTLGNFQSGGVSDVVPMPTMTPGEDEVPFGVSSAQALRDFTVSRFPDIPRITSDASTSMRATEEWDTGNGDSLPYKDD